MLNRQTARPGTARQKARGKPTCPPRRARGKKRAKRKSRSEQALALPPNGTAIATPSEAGAAPAQPVRRRRSLPRRASALVKAIFVENDFVDIATKLMKGEGDATAGKLYLQLLEYYYGTPEQQMERRGLKEGRILYQFVSNVPEPQYQTQAPCATNSSGTPLPATALAMRSQASDTTEEQEHD
jgi:hypothetical protein